MRIKIAVIGCINRDTVTRPGHSTVRGLGGILYNIFGLSELLADRAVILPVCNVGHDVSSAAFRLLSRRANVDVTNVRVAAAVNNHCHMVYRSDGERDELFTGFVPAISFDQLKRISDCDVALVNFISGRDLTLHTFARFRDSFDGIIYFDFHTLSLGLRRDGRRFLRKPKRWREYISLCDYLQVNSTEFNLLSGRPPERDSLVRFFTQHVRSTGSAMAVTLGVNGAVTVSAGSGKVDVRRAQVKRRAGVVDTTGAGDLFAAGFCAALALDKSLGRCLETAVESGTFGCTVTHPQDIRLRSVL